MPFFLSYVDVARLSLFPIPRTHLEGFEGSPSVHPIRVYGAHPGHLQSAYLFGEIQRLSRARTVRASTGGVNSSSRISA